MTADQDNEETLLQPDEKTVAFERGYHVYEMLWESLETFRQLPSASILMMRHVYGTKPEEEWHDFLSFKDRIGEPVKVELCWFRDPTGQGQVDFNLFCTADFTSKGLADIQGRCFFRGIDCTVIVTETQRTQFTKNHEMTMKGDK